MSIANDFPFLYSDDPEQEYDMDDTTTKPECELSGQDGNVFGIIGRVTKTLKRAGLAEQADEFASKAMDAGSYDEVLRLCFEYVDVS
jgi:hypothetical protein